MSCLLKRHWKCSSEATFIFHFFQQQVCSRLRESRLRFFHSFWCPNVDYFDTNHLSGFFPPPILRNSDISKIVDVRVYKRFSRYPVSMLSLACITYCVITLFLLKYLLHSRMKGLSNASSCLSWGLSSKGESPINVSLVGRRKKWLPIERRNVVLFNKIVLCYRVGGDGAIALFV